ncbi:MAG TPA: hypothetical protein DDZ51_15590 [Planctomycetaceae bacterium]|nr:hypothetical protein [Planctomycetaceae bacterium]
MIPKHRPNCDRLAVIGLVLRLTGKPFETVDRVGHRTDRLFDLVVFSEPLDDVVIGWLFWFIAVAGFAKCERRKSFQGSFCGLMRRQQHVHGRYRPWRVESVAKGHWASRCCTRYFAEWVDEGRSGIAVVSLDRCL